MDLKTKIKKFKVKDELKKGLRIELTKGQKPHTLFIGCSDSRIDAEILLKAKAGKIFQIRNIANIVPRKEEPHTNPSVISAIEYSVKVLNVKKIIVCGHSNCGGCAALRKIDEYNAKLPYTGEWISQSLPISDYVDYKYPDMEEKDKLVMLEKLNAIQQLDNLMTYEFIRERLDSGELNLYAYYYDIGTRTISVYGYDSAFSDEIKKFTSDSKFRNIK